MQEELLLSILPKHIADEMLQGMKKQANQSEVQQQQFNTMYMYRHENVRSEPQNHFLGKSPQNVECVLKGISCGPSDCEHHSRVLSASLMLNVMFHPPPVSFLLTLWASPSCRQPVVPRSW